MSFQHLAKALDKQRQLQCYRQTTSVVGGNQPQLSVGSKPYINFSSNDYLGLATEPAVIEAAQHGAAQWGCGSGGSPLITGHSNKHQYLQDMLSDICGQEAVMLFSSGFAANSGVLATLLQKDDYLLQDKLNHASLMEAGSNGPATMQRYRHNDMTQLTAYLDKHASATNKLIISEGVFSMDGDSGDLSRLSQLSKQHNAWLMVDDAHGFGLCGDGRGSCAAQDIKADILMATFGKAIGTSGAFVAADKNTIEYLTNFCRHYIYSTSLAMPIVTATIKSVELAQQVWRHQALFERIDYFKDKAKVLGLNLMPSNSAIQPLLVGSSEAALNLTTCLKSQGLWVSAIRPPTVAVGTARLRITLSTKQSFAQIDQLLQALAQELG